MNNPTPEQKTQVVIVGAGPTGLSMAVQLMRYNIDFIILEKNKNTTPFSKALVVQARTLEIFEETGIAEKAKARGRLTTAFNVFEKGKRKVELDLNGLGEGLSEFPFALSLEQCETEKLLVEYLTEHEKIILWNSSFTRFEESKNNITVYYKNERDEESSVQAQYIVGADGASSLIRHQSELMFKGDTVPKLFYVCDVKINSRVITGNKLYMFLIKKGFILFFPMHGDGNWRIVGILPDAQDEHPDFKFEELIPYLKSEVKVPLEFEEIRWFSQYKVHSRKADAFRKGRCFIAGDAAHIHTPAGGQGMNTGIQDAYNLAWKLALTLQGKVNASVLETYNTEREKNAHNLLRTTDRMFDILSGTNLFLNFLRLKLIPMVANFVSTVKMLNKNIYPLLSQIAITYDSGPLTVKGRIENIKAGVRMPYFVFEDGKNIFSFLKHPCFKIIFFGEKGKEGFDKLLNTTLEIKRLAFTEIPAHVFKTNKNFYVLLRPDNHISYIGNDMGICNKIIKNIAI